MTGSGTQDGRRGAPMDAGMSERVRILAVDDESLGVDLLRRSLRRLGEVHTATSGEAGWAAFQDGTFDLVVSDQRMPGMSGVELLARVAGRDAEVGRILLTGYADLHATVDAINEARVHAYLHKPCPPTVLCETVRSVLERVALGRVNARLLGELHERNEALESALEALRHTQQRVVDAERLSAVGTLAASIVHDFRSPLSVIASGARSLADGGDGAREAVREEAGRIGEEADRMVRMCADLLEATRVGVGAARRVEDDLDGIIESAMAALLPDAGRAGVELALALESGARLPLDEDRLRRALLNLGHNALEAMPEGGALHVASSCEGEEAVVVVRDTGCGIPEAVRERLFEPFVTAGKRAGTGLGLAVVKRVVDEHDGRIEVVKSEGSGTAFEIRLPLGVPDA